MCDVHLACLVGFNAYANYYTPTVLGNPVELTVQAK